MFQWENKHGPCFCESNLYKIKYPSWVYFVISSSESLYSTQHSDVFEDYFDRVLIFRIIRTNDTPSVRR